MGWASAVGRPSVAVVRQGARTPEELESLLEDAFVLRDRDAIAALFEERALLVGGGAGEARGSEQIARSVSALWARDFTYLADPRRVIQARELALVLAPQGTSVVRRGADGAWRYAISRLTIESWAEDLQWSTGTPKM